MDKENAKVSIIIPAYNAEKYLEEAIKSCLDQTVRPYEIIVINDGSTDRTEEIALSYLPAGVVYAFNSENRGIGYTRAKGVKLAKGDYIGFCSADDKLNPNFIEAMLSYAKSYPNSILYSDYELIDENGNKVGEARSPDFENYSEFVNACIETAKNHRMFVTYNIFAPTKLLRAKKIRFVHVPFLLFKYRIHRGMMTQKKRDEIIKNNLKTFRKINMLLKQNIFEV